MRSNDTDLALGAYCLGRASVLARNIQWQIQPHILLMARSIHISTARSMLNSGDPVDISVWKSDGSILELRNCISLRYNFYGGWRNVKLLASGECRKIRDCCIFRVNDCEVFL